MTTDTDTGVPTAPTTRATTPRVSTRSLLACGVAAAPIWATISLWQAATRDGFDLTRHPLSLLSNGALGRVQIANFVLAGVLATAGAAGLRRVLAGSAGGTWAPRLVALYGVGMVAAGVFRLDPADGFPVGTPLGTPATMSGQSVLHLVAGSVSFTALIVACVVLGRHFTRSGDRTRAAWSRLAGAALLLGDGWAVAGGRAGSATLALGAIVAMSWIAYVSARLQRTR